MTLTTDHRSHGDRQAERHHGHRYLLLSVPHKHTHWEAHTTNTQPYLHYQYRPCSVQDTELKGHSVLLLSPVKCHQATLVSSSSSVSHVTSFRTISHSLAAEVHQNIKQPTDRGEHLWDNAPVYILSRTTQWEWGKMRCNWDLLLSCRVYWIWRLDVTQEALLFESSYFIFEPNSTHFFGVKGNKKKKNEWMRGLWSDVSECADDNLGTAGIKHTERARSYLLCIFGVICGKEKIISVGNGLWM